MNLPGSIEALEQPIGLPSHVLDRSNEVRGKGGSRYLTNSWETISHLSSTDQKVLKEIIDTLNAEELEDQELKRIHQNLWTRTPSEVLTKKFREKANQYSENIKQADAANLIVEKKINTNMYLIEQLCMDRKALEQSIPSSTSQTTLALKDPLLIELKQVLKKIMQNFQTRAEISQEIKTIEKTDDIGPRLTKNAIEKTPLDDESLFALQFEIYDDQKKKILGMEKEQKQLLEKVVELNQKFMNSRQTNDMIRQRESALSNLEQAYRHFIDVETNLQEGIKFFAELENVLMGLKGQVLDYVRNRNLDRDHILMSIKNKSAYPLPPVQQMGNMQLGQPGIWNPHQSQGQSVQHGQVYQSQSQYNQYQGYQGQNQYAPQLQQFAQPQYGVWQPPQASQNPGIYNPSTPGAYPSQPGPPTYDQNRRK